MSKLPLLVLGLSLLATGCAHQAYPELPDDIVVQPSAPGGPAALAPTLDVTDP